MSSAMWKHTFQLILIIFNNCLQVCNLLAVLQPPSRFTTPDRFSLPPFWKSSCATLVCDNSISEMLLNSLQSLSSSPACTLACMSHIWTKATMTFKRSAPLSSNFGSGWCTHLYVGSSFGHGIIGQGGGRGCEGSEVSTEGAWEAKQPVVPLLSLCGGPTMPAEGKHAPESRQSEEVVVVLGEWAQWVGSLSWQVPLHRMSVQQEEKLGTLNPTVNCFYYVYSSSPYSGAKYFNSQMLQNPTNTNFASTHVWKEHLTLCTPQFGHHRSTHMDDYTNFH